MELYSDRFKKTVLKRLKDDIPVLAVLHRHHVEKYEGFGEIYELTESNYDILKIEVKEKVRSYLD